MVLFQQNIVKEDWGIGDEVQDFRLSCAFKKATSSVEISCSILFMLTKY
jgi:hypothetical protein